MIIFFFKQKTAYEMRISDWSSDVCSSDLRFTRPLRRRAGGIANADQRLDQPGRRFLGEIVGASDRLVEHLAERIGLGPARIECFDQLRGQLVHRRALALDDLRDRLDRKSTRLNSSH